MAGRGNVAAAVAAAVCAVAACGGSGAAPTATSGTAPASVSSASTTATGQPTVVVKDFSFGPAQLTVARGTTVTWRFEDSAEHTVTADNNSFASKSLKSGATYSHTFNTPGTYGYLCSIHQYMTGTVVVR